MNVHSQSSVRAWIMWILASTCVLMALCAVPLMLGLASHRDVGVHAAEPAANAAADVASAFVGVDVIIDSQGKKLAAYQVEITSNDAPGLALLAGVEGGEHPAFEVPPHYDPQALHPVDKAPSRIILAAFDVGNELPTGKTRVARLHVQWRGPANEQPTFTARLMASATVGGEKIDATVTLVATPAKAK